MFRFNINVNGECLMLRFHVESTDSVKREGLRLKYKIML
jgi:hypothetical protein